jgi:hypothetical protein
LCQTNSIAVSWKVVEDASLGVQSSQRYGKVDITRELRRFLRCLPRLSEVAYDQSRRLDVRSHTGHDG